MKEDVLEQIVDDYLQHQGFLTISNLRFKPSKDHPDWKQHADAVSSDIDVVGYRPTATDPHDRVWAVSCKAWQSGFAAERLLGHLRNGNKEGGREVWRHFRELWVPKWTAGFCEKVQSVTNQSEFTYVLAVTKLVGPWDAEEAAERWSAEPQIQDALAGRRFRILTLGSMWSDVLQEVTTTTAPSEIGRLIQLLVAANLVQRPQRQNG